MSKSKSQFWIILSLLTAFGVTLFSASANVGTSRPLFSNSFLSNTELTPSIIANSPVTPASAAVTVTDSKEQVAAVQGVISFETRVKYQEIIEQAYWQQRFGQIPDLPASYAFEQNFPADRLQAKVKDYLRKTRLLALWGRPITPADLQSEMNKMAANPQHYLILKEVWQQLGNDPWIIAETFVRPQLVERLVRELYQVNQANQIYPTNQANPSNQANQFNQASPSNQTNDADQANQPIQNSLVNQPSQPAATISPLPPALDFDEWWGQTQQLIVSDAVSTNEALTMFANAIESPKSTGFENLSRFYALPEVLDHDAAGGLIDNGGFESGSFPPWQTASGGRSGPFVLNSSNVAKSGNFYALAGTDSSISGQNIRQFFDVPANVGGVSASMFLNITSSETGSMAVDTIDVVVLDPMSGNTLTTLTRRSNLNRSSLADYTQLGPFDLSQFRGQRIGLGFIINTNVSNGTDFRIDDVVVSTSATSSDFSIALNPISRTVNVGETANYTIDVTTMGSRPDSINFTFSNLPPGTAAPAVSGNTSVPFQVITSSATPPGTYAFTITGTAGNVSRTATGILVVGQQSMDTQPRDFAIFVNPNSNTIMAGQSATYMINVVPIGERPASITFTFSNLPVGATAGPSNGNTTVPFTVATSAATPPGNYAFTVTGVGGGFTRMATAVLTVQPAANQPPRDFSIFVNPTVQNINAGETANFAIDVIVAAERPAMINFSFSNLPTGVTANPVNGNMRVPFTLMTSNSTLPGNYTFTVTGVSDGGLTRTATGVLVVQAPANQPPRDFTIFVNPTSQMVAAGDTANYTVEVFPVAERPGSINFTFSNLPAGATAAPVSGNTSVAFRIATTANTPVGTFIFTVTGMAGGITRTTSGVLVVQQRTEPPRDFSIFVNPTSQSINAGEMANFAIDVFPVAERPSSINFTFSNLPAGATAASVSGNANVQFRIATSSTTPTGTFVFTVTGVAGSVTRTTTGVLIVRGRPEDQPRDFTLFVNPNSQTAGTTDTANYTIAVLPLGERPAVVNFTFNGLPPGANAAPVTGNNNVPFTVTTNGTPPGTYAFTITGVSAGITRTTTAILIVMQRPEFSLTISPSTQTVSAGSPANYEASLVTSGGFNDTIQISFSGLPLGANVPIFNGNGRIPFQVTTSASTPPGTYNFMITGAGGGLTRSATATLIVTPTIAGGGNNGRPTINLAVFDGSQLIISGSRFPNAPIVLVNGVNRNSRLRTANDSLIVLAGKVKKLGINTGTNTVQIIGANGVQSDVFTFQR
jgi:uncharacterized membrane protein